MKILHSLEGASWSGGQQQTFFLAEGQQKLGHDVLLMCQKGGELEKRATAAGLHVRSVDYRSEMNPKAILQLLSAYSEFKPDIVNVHRAWSHTQWLLVSLLKRFRGLIVTRRVLFKPDFNPLSMAKYRSAGIRKFIAVSEAVADRLKTLRIPADKIKVIHPASDSEKFNPAVKAALSGEWPVEPGVPVALMVGNFSKNKGHQLLLDAFSRMTRDWPELHLVVAGHNTDCTELQGIVSQHNMAERVHLLGFRDDVPAMIQHSNLTISASYQEGFSGTVRESLLMGVPVIASDIPSNLEINSVVPLNLFACGKPEALARCLLDQKQKVTTPEQAQNLRNLAVKAFSVSSMVEKTLAVYKEICR